MKLIRNLLILVAVLIFAAIIAMFILPQEVEAEATERINASPTTVFNIVNNIENEQYWNPWQQQDTTMTTTFGDKTVGQGASYSWNSEKMGNGSATYTEVINNEKIVSALDFGSMGNGKATYTFKADGDGTLVNWKMNSTTGRPFNLMNFMIKGQTEKAFAEGLKNLNGLASEHTKGTYYGYSIAEEVIPARTYITNRGQVALDKMGEFYAQNLAPLFKKIQSANVEMNGHPSALVYSYNLKKGTTDMAAGIPIAEDVTIQGTSNQQIENRRAVVINYYGDRSKTETAHAAIDAYMADRGLQFDWPVVEEYITDPSEEPNPEKWLTKIIYYIAE